MHTALSFAGDNRTAVSFGLLAAMQSIVLLVVCPALSQFQSLSLFALISKTLSLSNPENKRRYNHQAAVLLTLPIPGVTMPEWMNIPPPVTHLLP
jgi:hypothetical protein